MKRLIAIFMWVVLAAATPAFAADPIFGMWKTIPDDNGKYGNIRIAPCGDKICGTLVASFNASDNSPYKSENIGKKLIWDMVNQGGGNYGGGKVWSPDRDKVYKGKLVLKGDKLTVRGCILFICRDGGVWSRVK